MMTNMDKILWAAFMASTDISEYGLDFYNMPECEVSRIWEEGLHITDAGKTFVVFPFKRENSLELIAFTQHEGTLIYSDWVPTDEELVSELKRSDFYAPWVDGMDIKNILIAKWGKNWKGDKND